MARQTLLPTLALFASMIAFCVIGLGAFTRLIDAGLGCPDWPGCYGHFIIPWTTSVKQFVIQYPGSKFVSYKAWAEMMHRYFVGVLSVMIFSIIVLSVIKKQYRTRANLIFSAILFFLVSYQIMLGQWTVTLKLLPFIVTQHLLGGFFILSTLWLMYLSNIDIFIIRQKADKLTKLLPFATIGCALLILQIILGAWTSTNYASLSCPDFPFCVNTQPGMNLQFKEAFYMWSPIGVNYEGGVLSEAARQTIQMTHRFGALIVSSYLFIFIMVALKLQKKFSAVTNILFLMMGLLFLQMLLGISNVIFKLPLVIAICHTLTAALLLLTLLTLLIHLRYLKRTT